MTHTIAAPWASLVLILIVASVSLVGCGTTAQAPTPNVQETIDAAVAATGAARNPAAGATTAKSQQGSDRPVARSRAPKVRAIVEALKRAGLPIAGTRVYTEETDPNELMGRPNQYIAKASWKDTRIKSTAEAGTDSGGTVEVFATSEDLQARKKYVEELAKTPMLTQYVYARGNVLIRLSKSLTPKQAKQYEAVLEKAVP